MSTLTPWILCATIWLYGWEIRKLKKRVNLLEALHSDLIHSIEFHWEDVEK